MKTIVAWIAALLALPLAAQGLKGEYYSNLGFYPRLPDTLRLVRTDTGINFSDDPARPAAAFNLPSTITRNLNTARWTGSFVAVAGSHRFTVETENGAVLSVDGNMLIDLRDNVGFVHRDADIALDAGPHFVELFYVRSGQLGFIRMTLLRLPATAIALATFSPSPTYPASYRSQSRTLDFEAPLSGGPYIVDQYAPGDGVHFVPLAGDLGFSSRPMIRTVQPIEASSGTHVVYNDSRDPIEGTSASARVPLTIRFDRPLLRVSLKSGMLDASPGLPPVTATLRAFNAAGQLVGADMQTSLQLPVRTQLEVARGTADVASISLDFGDHPNGETLDDLRIETIAAAQGCTPALPEVAFVEPVQDQEILAASGQVTAKFVVRESCGTLDHAALLSGLTTGTITSFVQPGCTPPGCLAFQGSIAVPPGTTFLRATATNTDGTFSNAVVRIRVRGARIHVTDEHGQNVSGAEVFVNGARATSVSGTNATGVDGMLEMSTPLTSQSRIVARRFLFENASPRGGHTRGSFTVPPQNWSYRVYNTSIFADVNGQFAPLVVGDANAVQEVVINSANTLFGLHVVASIEWDASVAELTAFRDATLLPASRYLFNATDGQMYFEQIDILDDAASWDDTDYRIIANNTLRPKTSGVRLSGFLGSGGLPTHMNMRGLAAATGVDDFGFTSPPPYAHELGHYGLGLFDEYEGWLDAHCTDLGRTGGPAPYNAGMPRTSCMMWEEWTATKLCSALPGNPHSSGNLQGLLNQSDCWSTIVANYGKDPAERAGQAPFFRFGIRTPVTRGYVPGAIADLPVRAWAPAVTLVNASPAGLCLPIPFLVTNSDGTPFSGANVWFTTTYGSRVYAGQTGTDGTIRLPGLHIGDVVETNTTTTITTCTPTM